MHSRVFLFLGVQEFVTFGILEAQESQYSQTQVKRVTPQTLETFTFHLSSMSRLHGSHVCLTLTLSTGIYLGSNSTYYLNESSAIYAFIIFVEL